MKIKFVKSPAPFGYAYAVDEECDTSDHFANEMVESGFAVFVHRDETELPAELPGRKILIENGICTLAELRKIKDPAILTEIKGIGNKLAQSIIEFITK